MIQVHTQVGFDANIGDALVKWEDVSDAVTAVGSKRGKAYELDRIESGTASITLDNADGRFTPGRNPRVKPRKPVRVFGVADNNHVHYECVNASAIDLDAPRWHFNYSTDEESNPAANTVTKVFDSSAGRDVFDFLSSEVVNGSATVYYHHGLIGPVDLVHVKKGQTIIVSAQLRNLTNNAGSDAYVNARGWQYSTYAAGGGPDDGGSGNGVKRGQGWVSSERWFTAEEDSVWQVEVECSNGSGGTPHHFRLKNLRVTLVDEVPPGVEDGDSLSAALGLPTGDTPADSGVYPVFAGHVERWTQEYGGGGKLSEVVAECADGMALLSAPIPTSYRYAVVEFDKDVTGDVWYWPAVESGESGAAYAYWNTDNHLYARTAELPSEVYGFSTNKTMVWADGAESGGFTVENEPGNAAAGAVLELSRDYRPYLNPHGELLIDMWYKPTDLTLQQWLWDSGSGNSESAHSAMCVNSDGSLSASVSRYSGPDVILTTPPGLIKVGETAHIGARFRGGVSDQAMITIYVNGVQRAYASYPQTPLDDGLAPQISWAVFGGRRMNKTGGVPRYQYTIRGTLNHILLGWDVGWDIHEYLNIRGFDTAIYNEAQQIQRVLSVYGWDGPRQLDPGLSKLLAPRWNEGADAREIAEATAESAGGSLFMGPAGEVFYHNRLRRVGVATRWNIPEWNPGLRFTMDDSQLYNVVTVERATGLSRTVTDPESVAEYGARKLRISREVDNPAEIQDAASWLLHRYGDPVPRCDSIRLDAHTYAGPTDGPLRALAYGASLSDRISLTELPASAPADEYGFFVEGLEIAIRRNGSLWEWSTGLWVSDARRSDAWVLEDDVSGVLDADACVAIY
ncbi:hypothetical protein AB0B57_22345 [Micromonospora sp. NPDC049101]|uniref:hypothetical protein n=1 Tax=Micromonospora sp. NPDC049101 TaxID=3155032 RepID=UPI0033CCD651